MYNNYYPQQQPTQQQYRQIPTMLLKGRPVSSIEEARASSIDFDGSIFFFPDVANKKIYTKQINMDGTMSLNLYELKEIPIAENIGYVTRDEFEQTINELKEIVAAGRAPQTTSTPASAQPAGRNFQTNF